MPARLAAYLHADRTDPPDRRGGDRPVLLPGRAWALKYRWAIDRLDATPKMTIRTIHVVGGGAKNALLCQFTADACARPVHAGPVEATAIGNILMQAIGRGRLGSIAERRAVVAPVLPGHDRRRPRDTAAWADVAGRFAPLVPR